MSDPVPLEVALKTFLANFPEPVQYDNSDLYEKSTDELWDEYISGMRKLETVELHGQQAPMYSDEWKAWCSEWQRVRGRLSDIKAELHDVKPTPHGEARKERERLEKAKLMEQRKAAEADEKRREEQEQKDLQESIREVREQLANLGKGDGYQAGTGLSEVVPDGPVIDFHVTKPYSKDDDEGFLRSDPTPIQDESIVSRQMSSSAIIDRMEDNKVEQTPNIHQNEEISNQHENSIPTKAYMPEQPRPKPQTVEELYERILRESQDIPELEGGDLRHALSHDDPVQETSEIQGHQGKGFWNWVKRKATGGWKSASGSTAPVPNWSDNRIHDNVGDKFGKTHSQSSHDVSPLEAKHLQLESIPLMPPPEVYVPLPQTHQVEVPEYFESKPWKETVPFSSKPSRLAITDGSHVLSRRVQQPEGRSQSEVLCLPRASN
jgi:hypothetical protein